jgi:hypothetical protein
MAKSTTIEAVLSLVNAQRWSESQDVLETRKQALWSAEADEVFGDLLQQHRGDVRDTAQIQWSWDILKAARAGGIPAAYARAQGRGTRFVIAAETMNLLQVALESGKQEQLDDVLDRHPTLIPVFEHLNNRLRSGKNP